MQGHSRRVVLYAFYSALSRQSEVFGLADLAKACQVMEQELTMLVVGALDEGLLAPAPRGDHESERRFVLAGPARAVLEARLEQMSAG